jgi:hypothetical protein
MTRAVRADAGTREGHGSARVLQDDDEHETRQWQGRDRPVPLSRARSRCATRPASGSPWCPRPTAAWWCWRCSTCARVAGVSWLAMRAQVGVKLGADGLRRRYSKALKAITAHLNRTGAKAALPALADFRQGSVKPRNEPTLQISFPFPHPFTLAWQSWSVWVPNGPIMVKRPPTLGFNPARKRDNERQRRDACRGAPGIRSRRGSAGATIN